MKGQYGYMYVFEYSAPAIYEIELDAEDEHSEASDILERRGFKESQCHYMTSEEKLEVKSINCNKK